jgi:endonuclease YncB( thermonuclease family)
MTRAPACRYLVILLCLASPAHATADTLHGRVVRILDGDTVEVQDSASHTERVRLGGIDAPEKSQPFGAQAKQRMAALSGGQTVAVDWTKRDRNGRIVGKLILNGQDLGLAMVNTGLAWWYRKYADEQSAADQFIYAAAEQTARTAKRGLWAVVDPMAPWDYRHQPAPNKQDLAGCLCGTAGLCTGPKGGRFCVTASGDKRYQLR